MRKRDLSEFMTIELLYDYKIGKLDVIRTAAIEEGLKNSAVARAELDKLDLGIGFCNQLKQSKVSDDFIKLLMERATVAEKIFYYLRWRNLPQAVKWSFEAALVACSIILFVTQFPNYFNADKKSGAPIETHTITVRKNNPIDLEIIKSKFETSNFTAKESEPKHVEALPIHLTEADLPEEATDTKVQAPLVLAPPVEKNDVDKSNATATETKTAKITNSDTGGVVPLKQAEPTSPAQTQVSGSAVELATQPIKTKPVVKRIGYIHRININISNVDEVAPEITNMIVSLGGKKAGEVELGWRKANGSYYHFTIPQENYDLLIDSLKKYGTFKVDKSEHPRVMPEGVLRFILWVEKTP